MFAIDGVKLPSNASKRRSGTRADFEPQARKLEAVAATMLQRHREADTLPTEPTVAVKAAKRIERLERDAAQIRDWLAADPWTRFRGKKRDCVPCARRALCLRTPATTAVRSVMFFQGKTAPLPETHTARMKQRIGSPEGRLQYDQRFGTVEPVFGNLCYNKGLTRFTLRGRTKVDGQWKLFCLVHNIEKLARSGYAQ
jgi:hypothetical protein